MSIMLLLLVTELTICKENEYKSMKKTVTVNVMPKIIIFPYGLSRHLQALSLNLNVPNPKAYLLSHFNDLKYGAFDKSSCHAQCSVLETEVVNITGTLYYGIGK